MIDKLIQELREIAKTGYLPDGDGVNIPTLMWAERWAERLEFVKWNDAIDEMRNRIERKK